ncbi:KdtA 3-deoxy-D-manno-octulosonic-acid transferase [Rhabdaerophilaceae bacterium]
MKLPLSLKVYRFGALLVTPLLPILLKRRLRRGKEHATRLPERLGHASRARPEGRLIWIHSASVGETMSVLPLVDALVPFGSVMLTTGTVTSAELADRRLPSGAFHQFVPLDSPLAVHRFFDHWAPDLVLFCESEFWPNLMMEAYARDIPLGLVNGRMSDRSFRRWQSVRGLIGTLLTPMALCTAQSDADATRLRALGAPAISLGNLKFDVPALPVDPLSWDSLNAAVADRPVLVAASTHPGEDDQIIAAARALSASIPDLLTVLVPRHPARGEAVAGLADGAPRRSLGHLPAVGDAFYVADTLGELGLFYRSATVAVIGGSLVEHGGHNPIEAIKWHTPVISGPYIANFRAIFADLVEADGVVVLKSGETLTEVLRALLLDPQSREALASRAIAALARHEGALDRTLSALLPILGQKAR